MTILKPFEILNTVEEYDGTKTVYFKANKSYTTDTNIENVTTMQNFYNFDPNKVVDVERKILELLEQSGWFLND
jgi:hypothetical protein